MKSQGTLKQFAMVFIVVLVVYAVLFGFIEHRRVVRGPWTLDFSADTNGVPSLVVHQPALGINGVRVVFPEERAGFSNAVKTLTFSQPTEPPFAVPFGEVVFEDLTFLPGTLTMHAFGHELELLPAVLVVNKKRNDWKDLQTVTLYQTNKFPKLFRPEIKKRY